MKRTGDYNQSPRHGKVVKRTQYEQAAYDRLGFIQGGRFMRQPQVRQYVASQALVRAKQGEKNYVDLANANYACDTTGSVTLIATIAQGASVNQRIGKKCVLRSLQCRGIVVSGTTTTTADAAYMIVYDKRPTGALPNITDILNSATSVSMNNDNNASRFSILKRVDLVFAGSVANTLTTSSVQGADWYLNLKGKPVTFNAAGTGAIGDIDEGALYLVTVGSSAGNFAPILGATFRTRFTEQ